MDAFLGLFSQLEMYRNVLGFNDAAVLHYLGPCNPYNYLNFYHQKFIAHF